MADLQTPTEASLVSTTDFKDGQGQVKTNANGTTADEKPLFAASLISSEVTAALPEGYSIRPLRKSDYHNGGSIALVMAWIWGTHGVVFQDFLTRSEFSPP
jgi:hypothetical protein